MYDVIIVSVNWYDWYDFLSANLYVLAGVIIAIAAGSLLYLMLFPRKVNKIYYFCIHKFWKNNLNYTETKSTIVSSVFFIPGFEGSHNNF